MEKRSELVRCCAEKTHGGVEETRAQRSRSAAAARYSTVGTVHPRCYEDWQRLRKMRIAGL
ncbi:hypothetical protein E2562_003499 [Oryza meyeriana var. granulata]|uniref:Uncharacterized protein n=1 Tax=Oryza meyeriana var. granulata TaxID=110450 RepID=A0A6G1CMZ7_9ORYZ|nr:hypothetical protein E2562_003499 [Oryza meyeriana var. granulata]